MRHRRPRHARPCVLAPTRSFVAIGGLAALAGLAVAGCAAVAGGPAGAAAAARHPAAIATPRAFVAQVAGPSVVSAADLAALRTTASAPQSPPPVVDPAPASGLASSGIPTTALLAYQAAAAREAARAPGCGISWPLLAAIGRVESDHGRFAGAVLHSDGLSTPRVIGIALDGDGTALIRDTDGGRLDGDTVFDRAVGPMQFIPSTWAGWGVDANKDGVKDPFNIFDATAAAADYLCAAGRDLTTTAGQVQAILSYNHSYAYVKLVMGLEKIYASGVVGLTVPVLPTTPEPKRGHPTLPPVDPGTPRGAPKPSPATASGSSTAAASPTASGTSTTPSCPPSGSPSGTESASPSTSASSSAAGSTSSSDSPSGTGSASSSATASSSPSCAASPGDPGSSSGTPAPSSS